MGAGDTVLDALSEPGALPLGSTRLPSSSTPTRGLNLASAFHVSRQARRGLWSRGPPKPPYALPEAHEAYAEEFLENLEVCLKGPQLVAPELGAR